MNNYRIKFVILKYYYIFAELLTTIKFNIMAKQYYANGDRKVTGIFCTINLTGKPEICPVHTIDFSIIIVKSNGKKFYRLTNEVINFQNAEGNVIDRAETIEKFN